MAKIDPQSLEYPVVIRKVLNDLVISIPDLGYWESLPLNRPKKVEDEIESSHAETSKSSKGSVALVEMEDLEVYKDEVIDAIRRAWIEIDNHKKNKKWLPPPSTFKQSVRKSEKDFTLPEFTKELLKSMSISENTVRREIARGAIQCYQTEGGHRRIPFSELERYLSRTHKTALEF